MNVLDVLLAALALALLICGLVRGLARTAFDVFGIVAAFVVASRLNARASGWFAFTGASDGTRSLLAYVALFALVLFAAELLGWLVRKMLSAAKLGIVDRLAGGAVGLVAALLVAALLILPTVAYAGGGDSMLDRSLLAPYVVAVADVAVVLVPTELQSKYRSGVETLRKHWRGEFGREVVRLVRSGGSDGA